MSAFPAIVLTNPRAHARSVRTAVARYWAVGFAAVVMVGTVRAADAQETADRSTPNASNGAPADSARHDSVAVKRKRTKSTFTREASPTNSAAVQGQQGAINPRLLPDISAVGDFVADLSPDSSTQESRNRFNIREVEIAVQAAVDPFFRGDVFFGVSDAEGIAIEQAYLTATSLPWNLEVRLGRFLAPVTKQNTTHRHDLHTVEYPYLVQRFFGPEGLRGTGVWVSRVFSPFGFYQELIFTAADRLGEPTEGLTTDEPVNRKLSGLAYSARFRNYWDLSQSMNVELSGSAVTGLREQPVSGADAGVTAAAARQTVFGGDLTYRWRPLQQGLYKSFILQAEVMRQTNGVPTRLPAALPGAQVVFDGPDRSFNGAYVFARYQTSQRGYLGGRVDVLQDPLYGGGGTNVVSGIYEFFPSEFSKLVAQYERVLPPGRSPAANRILFQASFALGPHKPHPF